MESLSDYMLLDIFSRLRPATLRTCTKVCKRWNNLISQSTSTMSKLTLNVGDSSKLRDLRHVNRRYVNMRLIKMNPGPKTWSLLLSYQPNLRMLELKHITITESDYVKMFQRVSTFQEINIIDCSLRLRNNRRLATVKMPLLQKLTIRKSNGFLENIDGSGLRKLELNQVDITKSNYVKMLQILSTLQELTIYFCSVQSRNDGEGELVQMPMLQKLTINSRGFLDNIDGSGLKKLECFCGGKLPSGFISSLEKLEDLFLTSLSNDVVDSFASAKVQLKKLKIDLTWPRDDTPLQRRIASLIKAHASTLETLEIKVHFHSEVTVFYLTNVAPCNSLSTQSFDDFFFRLININLHDSPELFTSTAKYYIPYLKIMKIHRPRLPSYL